MAEIDPTKLAELLKKTLEVFTKDLRKTQTKQKQSQPALLHSGMPSEI